MVYIDFFPTQKLIIELEMKLKACRIYICTVGSDLKAGDVKKISRKFGRKVNMLRKNSTLPR